MNGKLIEKNGLVGGWITIFVSERRGSDEMRYWCWFSPCWAPVPNGDQRSH